MRRLLGALGTAAGVLLASLLVGAGGDQPAEGPLKPDPVALNGPIFVDWPKPQLAILFSGEIDGYIEPCGCAGLENQKGGLKRRHTLVKQLQAQGWPLALVDVGGLTKRLGPQTEVKLYYILRGLVSIGYQFIGLGPRELSLNPDAVAYALSNVDGASQIVGSTNVGVYALDSGLTTSHRVLEIAGKRIGVTAVMGQKHLADLTSQNDVATAPPLDGLRKAAAALAAQKCDYQILLVYGDPDEATALSRQFPQFHAVMTSGGADEPPATPKKIAGSGATLIDAGHKGMYVIVMGMFADPDPAKRIRFQRVPLDARFEDSPEMKVLLQEYQQELESRTLAGLGLTGNSHPDGEFAGSAACADCHTAATEAFEKTPHAHATDTLVKLDPPRHFDPECLSCHVTGWNPQEYFPYASGYVSLDATPELKQNGCENCHGPGQAHVDAEWENVAVTDQQKEALRAALRLKIVANEGNKPGQVYEEGKVVKMCMQCHDLDNSPDFDFQEYWPHVKHEGKE